MNTNRMRVWLLTSCGVMVLAMTGLAAMANQDALPDWTVPYGKEFWKSQTSVQTAVAGDPAGQFRYEPGFNLAEAVSRRAHELRPEKDGVVGGSPGYAVRIGENGITLTPPVPESPNARISKSAATAATDPRAALNLHTREIRRGGNELYAQGMKGEPGAWVVQGNTAQKRLGACGIVEHVESRPEGVEVSWILREQPAGSGPLSVIMDMDGVRFDGATRSGLRFADASGAERLRVADATAVDSAGRRWALPTTSGASGLQVEVPEQVLTAARYPLAIDPLFVPQMVKDINPGSSFPLTSRVVIGTKMYFAATHPVYGKELWVTDGTVEGTTLVKDINPSGDSSPANLTVMGSTLYFTATDGSTGVELWKSDGTSGGTVQVADINTSSAGASSSPASLTVMNGVLYFSATDGSSGSWHGIELWKYDGTTAPSMVGDINTSTAAASSSPGSLTVMNNVLYFRATDGTTTGMHGSELWKYDGTTLSRATDINTGTLNSVPNNLTVMNNVLYFSATDGTTTGKHGTELWKYDGTTTSLVADINSGTGNSSPANLTVMNNMLYFTATDGSSGIELWKSDGTTATRVADINSGSGNSSPANLTVIGSMLYFTATDGSTGIELWKSDGTTASQVKDINNGSGNGLTATTPLTVLGTTLYFPATDGSNGIELWKSDGTSGGTVQVKDIYSGFYNASPANLTVFNGSLYFQANDGSNGTELWKSDGTSGGTAVFKDIAAGTAGSSPLYQTVMGSALYFFATDGSTGYELWKSDGTSAGTVLVKDINSGVSDFLGNPAYMTTLGSTLYFEGNDGSTGIELWKSDGTASGTALVKDINSGVGSAFSTLAPTLVTNGATLFFAADDGLGGSHGLELWKSDGTSAGTLLVADIRSGSSGSIPGYLTVMNGTLYFSASDGSSGAELWKSDGTTASRVADINSGSGNSSPANLTVMGSTLFFAATDGSSGVELWKSDGTTASRVADINFGAGNSSPANLTVMGSTLYFTATDGSTGVELWKSDGTTASLVKDINSSGDSSPANLTVIGSTLYFSADDGVNGRELWKSDGTSGGTLLVKDINSGSASSSPTNLATAVTGSQTTLVFAADNGVNGSEPWQSDGTSGGTYMIADLNAGSLSSTPGSFRQVSTNIFFAASNTTYGLELWLMTQGSASLPIINNSEPTNVVSGSAWANATLTQNGGEPATVFLYWGQTDGGNNAANWAHTNAFAAGDWADGSSPTTNLTGLSAGEWFYTYAASNSSGVAWGGTSKYFLQSGLTIVATDASCGALPSDYATVRVYRAVSCTSAVLKVNYTTEGVVTNGTHYTATPASGTLQFSAGSTSAVITIAAKAPWNMGAAKDFYVTLTNGLYLIGSPSSATCTLQSASSATYTWDGSTANWTNTSHWTNGFPGLLPVSGATGVITNGMAQMVTNLYNPGSGETAPAAMLIRAGGTGYYDRVAATSLLDHAFVLSGGTLASANAGVSYHRYDYDIRVMSNSTFNLAANDMTLDGQGFRLYGALRDYDASHTGKLTRLGTGGLMLMQSNSTFSGGWDIRGGQVQAGSAGALGMGDISVTNGGSVGWGFAIYPDGFNGADTNMPSITVWNGGALTFFGEFATVAHYSNAPNKTITLKDGGKIGTMAGDWMQISVDAPLHVTGNVTLEYTSQRKTIFFAGDMISDGPATITWNGKAGTDAGYTAITKADNAYTGNWILTTIGLTTYLSVQSDGALGTGLVELRSGPPVLDISKSLTLYNLIYGAGTLGTANRTLTLSPRYRNSTLTDAGVAPGTNWASAVGTLAVPGNLTLTNLVNYDGNSHDAYCKVNIMMTTDALGAGTNSMVQVAGNLNGLTNADLTVSASTRIPDGIYTIVTSGNDISAQRFHSTTLNGVAGSVLYNANSVQLRLVEVCGTTFRCR